MRFTIERGTPANHGEHLCLTCRHARITRGQRVDEEVVVCNASHLEAVTIRFKVASCTAYMDARVPNLPELLQRAWILRPANAKRDAGFVRARDLRDREFAEYMAGLDDAEDD